MYRLPRAHSVIPGILHERPHYCPHNTTHPCRGAPRLCACCMISAAALSGCAANNNDDVYYHTTREPTANTVNCSDVDDDFPAAACY
jgi:hypothetical protein